MNRFLQLCVDGKTLTAGEAETLMNMMMAAEMTPSEMGGDIVNSCSSGGDARRACGFCEGNAGTRSYSRWTS